MHIAHTEIGTGEAGPPFANRGVAPQPPTHKHRTNPLIGRDPTCIGVDYLTATLRTDRAAAILQKHEAWSGCLVTPGGGSTGFRRSEERPCLGGRFWRKFDPTSESKLYGLDYESWDASGDAASGLARELLPVECYATRVDIAFDYIGGAGMKTTKPEHLVLPQVDPSTVSDDPAVKLKTKQGFIVGFSGEGGCNTAYVGGKQSDRRIRIYRKDLQSPSFADWAGPCLRVELVLRSDHAKAWWTLYREDRQEAYRAAAAHIEEMLGFNPQPGGAIPDLEKPAELDLTDSLFQLVNQYAATIVAYEDAGVDLRALCRAKVQRSSKWSARRLDALRARLGRVDPDTLTHRVLGLIVKHSRSSPTP